MGRPAKEDVSSMLQLPVRLPNGMPGGMIAQVVAVSDGKGDLLLHFQPNDAAKFVHMFHNGQIVGLDFSCSIITPLKRVDKVDTSVPYYGD